MEIRKVAAAAAGDSNLFSNGIVAFEDDDRATAFSCFNSAHQAGRAGTDDNAVSCLRLQETLPPPPFPRVPTSASTRPHKPRPQSQASAPRTREVHEQYMPRSELLGLHRWISRGQPSHRSSFLV